MAVWACCSTGYEVGGTRTLLSVRPDGSDALEDGEEEEVWTSRCVWKLNNPSLIISKGKYLLPIVFRNSSFYVFLSISLFVKVSVCVSCLSLSNVSVLKCFKRSFYSLFKSVLKLLLFSEHYGM